MAASLMLLFQARAGAGTSELHWVMRVLASTPKYWRALSTWGLLDLGVPQTVEGGVPMMLARIFNSACGLRRMRLVISRKYCSSLVGRAAVEVGHGTRMPRAARS